jgi:hypothetical protein
MNDGSTSGRDEAPGRRASAADDSDDRQPEPHPDTDDQTPEEAGYGYGV